MRFLNLEIFYKFGFFLILTPLAWAEPTYPEIRTEAPAPRIDSSLNYSNSLSLYDVKKRELTAIIDSVRAYSANHSNVDQNKMINDRITERNLEQIKKLNSIPLAPATQEGFVSALTADQIKQTAASIELSPATDSRASLNEKYNPKNLMGFCFLRAHYYAAAVHQRGLQMDSVRKIFLVGTMKLFGAGWAPIGSWRYHVATAVRGVDGKWYVLDNHLALYLGKHGYSKKVYTVEQWYDYYHRFMATTESLDSAETVVDSPTARAKALFLYVAEADRMIPEPLPYIKSAFYGSDRNNDGELDSSEIVANGAFRDVDRFGSSPIHPCSSERYASLAANHSQCINLSEAERGQIRARELMLNNIRLEVAYEEDQASASK